MPGIANDATGSCTSECAAKAICCRTSAGSRPSSTPANLFALAKPAVMYNVFQQGLGCSGLHVRLYNCSGGVNELESSVFPSLHHRKEGWPSDPTNVAKPPLIARPGWFS